MRILILWTRLSGYMVRQFELLTEQYPETKIIAVKAHRNAPYSCSANLNVTYLESLTYLRQPCDLSLYNDLINFGPHLIISASWCWSLYRKVIGYYRRYDSTIPTVCAFDNQYIGTLKQRLGATFSPLYIQTLYKYALIPGQSQLSMAVKLGFKPSSIFTGLYTSQFNRSNNCALNRRFVFLGRLVREKGIRALSDGYRRYYEHCPNPWPLYLIGNGEGESLFASQSGVRHIKYLIGQDFQAELQKGGVLVAPSLLENWGVNIHDATRFSMPLIVPRTSGASSAFALNGINSYILDEISSENIFKSFLFFHELSSDSFAQYASASLAISDAISPMSFLLAISAIIAKSSLT